MNSLQGKHKAAWDTLSAGISMVLGWCPGSVLCPFIPGVAWPLSALS